MMSAMRDRARVRGCWQRRPAPRPFYVLVALLQVLIGLASFQIAELGHFTAEVAEEAGLIPAVQLPDDPRENEPGHECPPGCPKCHHVHPSNAAIPWWALPAPSTWVVLDFIVVDFPAIVGAPLELPPMQVYRPPRPAPVLT